MSKAQRKGLRMLHVRSPLRMIFALSHLTSNTDPQLKLYKQKLVGER